MDDTIEWLKDRPYYDGQIISHEVEQSQRSVTEPISLDHRVEEALQQQGIESPYRHQAETVEKIRTGENVTVATPTASGKTLTYTIPAFERALAGQGKTLYIAPMRALINNQLDTLSTLSNALPNDETVEIAKYTGATPNEDREKIREQQPDIVLMTPDMIHQALLPWSKSEKHWEWLLQDLETVVIDEVHRFSGVFGSHVSLIFRRLNRMAQWAGSDPQYICCSATIGNPVEHAAAVTGKPATSYSLIDEDASDRGARHWLFWNPPLKEDEEQDGESLPAGEPFEAPHHNELIGAERRSHHPETARIFSDLVQKGFQTLVFTKTRQGAEQYSMKCDSMLRKRADRDLAENITAYHGQLADERRAEIEDGLSDGSVRGVWSTDALELGIDIGTLDVVLLDGYPGTARSLMQCAGRAGRGDEACLVVLVASPNPLDQYHMQQPSELLTHDPEQATLNPENQEILPDHVCCAAHELYLRTDTDEQHFGDTYPDIVTELTDEGCLDRFVDSNVDIRWESTCDSPQQSASVRAISDELVELYDPLRDEKRGKLPLRAALRDAHPGAIYYHQKEGYRATDIDIEEGKIFLESEEISGYTRPITEKDVSITETTESKMVDSYGLTVSLTNLTVEEKVDGYIQYAHMQDEDGDKQTIDTDLPTHTLQTKGLHFTIPEQVQLEIQREVEDIDPEEGFVSALHAVEHALISLFPLHVLCSRGDIGGLSTNRHAGTGKGTIFIHEGYPGGVGLVKEAYKKIEGMFDETLEMLQNCPCESGCPSCVHSPQCGNVNRNLDKNLAIRLLKILSNHQPTGIKTQRQ